MKPVIPTLLVTLAFAVAAPAASDESRSIVEVIVAAQRSDVRLPWRHERTAARSGYGVVVDKNKVLTPEDLVRNAVFVEVRRPGEGDKVTAKIRVADCHVNAALLDIEPGTGIESLPAVQWANALAPGAKVRITEFDDAGQPQNGDGRLSEIAVEPLPGSPNAVLTFKVLTDLKLDRIGAPVFQDGKLAGLVMQYEAETQTSVALPAPLLRTFLDDASKPPYKGVATAGVAWTALVDPAKRRFLGLADDNTGVLVLQVIPGSGAAPVLSPGDVILEWGGMPLDAQGYYMDAEFGRLLFPHLVSGRHRPGDTIPAKIMRNKERKDVNLTLTAMDDSQALIPQNVEGREAEYLVDGGLVLRELTADYLMAHGPKWMLSANPRLVNLYLTRAQFPAEPGERVVILAAVLPDPINVGYQTLHDQIVTQVNGQKVRNLKDVFAIVDRDGTIQRLSLMSSPLDLVLDAARVQESNARILKVYRIPELRHRRDERQNANAL